MFSFLSLLPSPFSQLLSASPRRVQGSISFNNLHIHDSHREWHPAGLDHYARTRLEPSTPLSHCPWVESFLPGGRRPSQINHFRRGTVKKRIVLWFVLYLQITHTHIYICMFVKGLTSSLFSLLGFPYTACVIHMKPAQWNYDLAEPVLADYSFCLSIQGMPDMVTQRDKRALERGHSQSGSRSSRTILPEEIGSAESVISF